MFPLSSRLIFSPSSPTHTQICKHRQTGSSHCSSFVYTLPFRNTSHMFCTRLANGGLFPTGDPIVPFVISPRFECLNKLTHTLHMALVGYLIVFSFVTKCGQTIEFLLWGTIVPLNFLVGYHCSIAASTPTYGVRVHTQSCVRCILRTSYCSPLLFPLLLDLNFFRHLPLDLYTFFYGTYGVLDCLLYCAFSKEFPSGVLLFLLKCPCGVHCSIVASTPQSMAYMFTDTHTHLHTPNIALLLRRNRPRRSK